MSSSSSPCAACKNQRRKCTQECVFAPYFPPDNPQKFVNVHRVFGSSNVAKILNDLDAAQRGDAVKSLAYEAEVRIRDPVYGCAGLISVLQQRLKQVQIEVLDARKELAAYIGPQAMLPILQPPGAGLTSQHVPNNNMPPPPPMMGIPTHQQQIFDAQAHQLAAAVAQHELMQQELLRLNGGHQGGSASTTGFNQMSTATTMSPSLALGPADYACQIQQHQAEHHHPLHHQLQSQLMLSPQYQPQPPQSPRSKSEEGRSMGPSY